jgi:hypothetical protein
MMNVLQRFWAPYDRKGVLALHAIILVPLVGFLVALSLLQPDDLTQGRGVAACLPPCPYRTLTGDPCPTCGVTRGVSACLHGRFDEALRYNAMAVGVFCGCVVLAALGAYSLVAVARCPIEPVKGELPHAV